MSYSTWPNKSSKMNKLIKMKMNSNKHKRSMRNQLLRVLQMLLQLWTVKLETQKILSLIKLLN